MNDEETKLKRYEIGMELNELSVEELLTYADHLRLEIERLEQEAKAKSEHLTAANALFKS